MCYEIKPIIQVAGWGEGLSSCSCMNIFNLHAPFSQLTKKKRGGGSVTGSAKKLSIHSVHDKKQTKPKLKKTPPKKQSHTQV